MGLRSSSNLGTGLFLADEQNTTHVCAGTKGRLLRLCMNVAREYPEWRASGPIEEIPNGRRGFSYRQKLTREESE